MVGKEAKYLWKLQPCSIRDRCTIKLGTLVPLAVFIDLVLLFFAFEKKSMAALFFSEQYLSSAVLNQSPRKAINTDFSEFGCEAKHLCNPTTEERAHAVVCCLCAQVETL